MCLESASKRMSPFSHIIAGPCAAETEQQVLTAAAALKPLHVIFRAGIWKPRTAPESFQGIGDKGLEWLQRVQQECGLEVATEVATVEQVEKATKAGIDYLWIGARTAANPIQVQALADAIARHATHRLKGIWVKNPVNEDAALWAGDIRRMQATGLPVWAIHRGCEHRPCWAMANLLRHEMKDVPLLLDPSHLTGDAQQVATLCQTAADLCMNGLMVEVHPTPKTALSDSRQQITPETFSHILQTTAIQDKQDTELKWLRKEIDEADDKLWDAIMQRMLVSEKIGAYKKLQDIAVIQPTRFQEILSRRKQWGKAHGISEPTVEAIMNALHQESIQRQT